MQVVKLQIIGRPKPKSRPRFGNGNTYTPAETAKYERRVRRAYKHFGYPTFDGAVNIHLHFTKAIPKSWNKEMRMKAEQGLIDDISRADLDNLVKAVCDGLNGVAYVDDSRISVLIATKSYAEEPSVKIVIWGDGTNESGGAKKANEIATQLYAAYEGTAIEGVV